jgi:hypothetical protein
MSYQNSGEHYHIHNKTRGHGGTFLYPSTPEEEVR